MKKLLFALLIPLFVSTNAYAHGVQYNMRIDGITCPFCVATSAKALRKIEGVQNVGADLEKGLITVCANETVTFTDKQLKELFLEKGFTYRGMEKLEHCDPE